MFFRIPSCRPERRLRYLAWLIVGLVGIAPAHAQQVFLPVDLGEGVLLQDETPKPFIASVRFHPALGIGPEDRFRIGPSFGAAFTNPGVSAQVGGRVQGVIKEVRVAGFSVVRFDLAAEALWGTKDRTPLGGALLVSAGRVLRFSLRGGYDLGQEAAYAEAGIGTDLSLWLGIEKKAPRPPPIPIPYTGCVFDVYTEAKVQALAGFEDDDGDPDAALIEALQAFLDRQGDAFQRQPDLTSAMALLGANDLDAMARQMEETLAFIERKPDCQTILPEISTRTLLEAFRTAWTEALRLQGGG